MAQNMSTEQRRFFENLLRLAEPYPDDAPELLTLDDDTVDMARLRASMAKKFLEKDNSERTGHNT